MFTDDEDFIPVPSSNLSSLFDTNLKEGGNFNLTYTPPKQPKKVQPKSSRAISEKKNVVDLLLFKFVEAFKLDNGKYQACGTTGVAVLGNEETRFYQLLLYKDKLNHLCTAKINCQFKFLNQAKNYATFYDKNNQVWSVLFSSNEDVIEFSNQVALAKFNSEEKSYLMSQNLWLPSDIEKENKSCVGDSVEFQYTIYEQEKLNRLTQKSSGKMTAKVDSSGWEQELQNVYKGSQILLIIPAEHLGEWKTLVPNCSILFVKLIISTIVNPLLEVTIASKDSKISFENSESSKLSNEDTTVLARGESIKNAITNPKNSKANLISRMARMGQATLPVTGPSASDSDTEEDRSFRKVTKPEIKPRTRNNENIVQTIPTAGSIINTTQPQWPIMMYPPVMSSPNDSSMSVFFSEVRTHNSELRMGITRVTDKVDNILTKLDNRTNKPAYDETLLASVDRLTHENCSLKKQLEKNFEDLQEQNREIFNLLRSSRLKSEEPETIIHNALPIPNVSGDKELAKQLAESQDLLDKLREQLNELQQCNEELNDRLMSKESDLTILQEQCAKKFEENNLPVENYEKEIHELKINLKNAEEETSELKDKHKKDIEELNTFIKHKENELLILEETNEKYKADTIVKLNEQESEIKKLKEERGGLISQEEMSGKLTQKSEENEKLLESLQMKDDVIKSLEMKLKQREMTTGNAEVIKRVMNSVYKHLKSQFQQDVMYKATEIQAVLVETIKAVTYHYLESDPNAVVKPAEQEKIVKSNVQEHKGAEVQPIPQVNDISLDKFKEVQNEKDISKSNLKTEADDMDVMKLPESKTVTSDKVKSEISSTIDATISQSSRDDTEDRVDDAWQPQPPPPPLFDEDDNEDDWFNS